MGLDCIVQYYDENTKNYSEKLPHDIAEKLEPIKNYALVGFSITEYKNKNENSCYYYISFRGKAYNEVVQKITKQSLYNDLTPTKLQTMYLSLETMLENMTYIEEIQEIYNTVSMLELNEWLEMLSDMYIPSPDELIGLKELFKICYKNNLRLYACY